MSKKIKLFGAFALSVLCFLSFSLSVFAEDDVDCNGRITGVSVAEPGNPNAGQTSFNAHPGTGEHDGEVTNLSILGLGEGLAPANRQQAACVDNSGSLEGWAWNTSAGFISLSCWGGENKGVACGDYAYGTYVMKGGLTFDLSGYGYSETFGWINFECENGLDYNHESCGDIPYGVTMNRETGALSGYAYTEAGLYLSFDGVTIEPLNAPEEGEVAREQWCDGRPYACVQIETSKSNGGDGENNNGGGESLKVKGGEELPFGEPGTLIDENVRLADGLDYYDIHLYLRGSDGNGTMNKEDYPDLEIIFEWKDTVKANQVDAGTTQGDFDSAENTWNANSVRGGAIPFKPVKTINWDNFYDYFQKADDDVDGHYVLKDKYKIVSYAPTKSSNFSFTESLQTPIKFLNEVFLTDIDVPVVEANEFILKKVIVNLKDDDGDVVMHDDGRPVTPIYPNGKSNGVYFEFAPVVSVSTLSSGGGLDQIEAYRNIPVVFSVFARMFGSENDEVASAAGEASVSMYLKYDQDVTDSCGDDSENVPVEFEFSFLESNGDMLEKSIDKLMGKNPLFVEAIATFSGDRVGEDVEGSDGGVYVEPCSEMEGPSLYTVISYKIDGKGIKYYSNKLPRIAGDLISNLTVSIHGNVYEQNEAIEVSSEVQSGQRIGESTVSVVRDTINQNLKKYFEGDPLTGGNSKTICEITAFSESGVSCGKAGRYKHYEVGDENVYYFKDADVELNLNNGTWDLDVRPVLIVEGGNLFLMNDVYNPGEKSPLPVVVLSEYEDKFYGTGGNVYIDKNLRNGQISLVADGSMFSFDGNPNHVNSESGEPIWDDVNAMVAILNGQLYLQGSFSSLNTIGVADTGDFVIGTGEIVEGSDQIRPKLYDYNFFRFFGGKLEYNDAGFPIDHSCNLGLSNSDILDIREAYESGDDNPSHLEGCDGIDIRPNSENNGDLVLPDDRSLYSDGLAGTADEYNPVVIQFVPPVDSFVFQVEGGVSID